MTTRPTPLFLFIALSATLVCLATQGQANTSKTTSMPPLDRFAIIPDRIRLRKRNPFPTAILKDSWPWRTRKKRSAQITPFRRKRTGRSRGPH